MRQSRNVQITELSVKPMMQIITVCGMAWQQNKRVKKFSKFSVNSCCGIPLYSILVISHVCGIPLYSILVICKIINVSERVISLAFSSADNSYLDIDNSAYHKNLVQ